MTTRWSGWDIALAGVLAIIGLVGTTFADQGMNADRSIDAIGYGLVLAAALALAVRRRWPLVTIAIAGVATSSYLIAGYTYGPIMVSFLIAVYSAARHLPLARSVPAALVAFALIVSHIFTNSAALPGWVGVVPAAAWVVVPFSIGVTVRIRQQSIEQARAELVRQRVDDERLRVAQEVHDIVGHGLAAIKMQADVALHVLAKKPDQAETALTAISRTSTEALEELRSTLALVRRPDGGNDDVDARTPGPGLRELDALRDRMVRAGVHVDFQTSGTARRLPPAIDVAAYRIVQESLTNVLRHSEAKVATVRVGYDTDAVSISIVNPVRSADTGGAGSGISGMRNRVEALGGRFSAGPADRGIFEVRAWIPTAKRA